MPQAQTPRPRGRRTGTSTSREQILEAALRQFAERGYGSTSIRSVAAAVDVDPSLVTHFFGTKEALFSASLELLHRLSAHLAEVTSVEGDPIRRAAEAYFAAWEDPILGPRLMAVARAVSESPVAGALLTTTLEGTVISDQARAVSQEALAEVQAMYSRLFGAAFARYVLRIQPLADLPLDEFIALIAGPIRGGPTRAV